MARWLMVYVCDGGWGEGILKLKVGHRLMVNMPPIAQAAERPKNEAEKSSLLV